MADVEHAQLPDELLHEPKGASTAADGEVYVADGAGAGSFKKLPVTSLDMSWSSVSPLSNDADLSTVISKVNELIFALKDEGLIE